MSIFAGAIFAGRSDAIHAAWCTPHRCVRGKNAEALGGGIASLLASERVVIWDANTRSGKGHGHGHEKDCILQSFKFLTSHRSQHR